MSARRSTRSAVGVLAVLAVLLTAPSGRADVSPTATHTARFAPAHLVTEQLTSRQLASRGLRSDPAACSTLYADARPAGPVGCTHGADELVPASGPAGSAAQSYFSVSTPPGIPCYRRGPFVHVFYAYPKGSKNRVAARRPLIREAVAMADQIYQKSAARVGAVRHVRWRTSGCSLVVTPFATTRWSLDVFGLRHDLQSRGLLGRREKGLVFAESGGSGGLSFGCSGIGELQPDTRASLSSNRNNRQSMVAAVDGGCISDLLASQDGGGMVAAHELGHTLGAVQSHAPGSNDHGHCVDEWDVMCYADGSGRKLVYTCGKRSLGQGNPYDRLLDCGLNTYFNPKPKPGSYLATHWNIARSSWLASTQPLRWDRLFRPRAEIVSLPGGTIAGSQVVHVRTDPSVTRVQFAANGVGFASTTTGTRQPDGRLDFAATLETVSDGFGSGYANGSQVSLAATATDAYGRPGAAPGVVVTVSNPSVTLTSPTEDSVVPWAMPWSATATAGPGRGVASVSLLVRRNGTVVATAATDTNPADGYGGTVDLTSYAAETTLEVAARITDSAGAVVTTAWVLVRLPGPPAAFLNLPFDAPAGSQVPMFATVDGGAGSAVTVEFWADGTLIGTDSTAPYVASLPAERATQGDHEIAIWVDESSGRRTQGDGSSITVGPPSRLSLSGITDGSTVSGTVTLSATWSLLPGMDPSTASVSFSLGDASAFDDAGPPWSAPVDTTQTTPGLAFVQAIGNASSSSNPDLTQFDASPVLLVTVG